MAKGSNPTVSVPVAGSDTAKGVTYLCAGLFIFSFQDIIVKLLSSTFPVHELVFARMLKAIGKKAETLASNKSQA